MVSIRLLATRNHLVNEVEKECNRMGQCGEEVVEDNWRFEKNEEHLLIVKLKSY